MNFVQVACSELMELKMPLRILEDNMLIVPDFFFSLFLLILCAYGSCPLQAAQFKSNILRFSGFVWHENEVMNDSPVIESS